MDSITDNDFEARVGGSAVPAVVIFTNPDCKPCKLMAADLEELETAYRGDVAFFRVDTSTEQELASKLTVVSTPTLILFVDGKPALRLVGYKTSHDIRTRIDEQLKISTG